MNRIVHHVIAGLILSLGMTGCNQNNTASKQDLSDDNGNGSTQRCENDSTLSYVCGLMNAEDIHHIGDSGLLLVSGMADEHSGGHIYLLNPTTLSYTDLVSAENYSVSQDNTLFGSCPSPLNTSNFGSHGLAVQENSKNEYKVYSTSHGDREAIEIFSLKISDDIGQLTWQGCVELDPTIMHNSVAILEDGGFITTEFIRWDADFADIYSGRPTGGLLVWHPGMLPIQLDGTQLAGPNGILVSDDNNTVYVAEFGSGNLITFDLSTSPVGIKKTALTNFPDNLRWAGDNQILAAGNNISGEGWSVSSFNLEDGSIEVIANYPGTVKMQGISVAEQLGEKIWVGTYSGDRVGYFNR
jgi:DNA-binding beta-propeller fold protein YncE